MRIIRLLTMAPFVLFFSLHTARPQVVDCIVAEVNGKAMTLTDIRILQEFAVTPADRDGGLPVTLRQALEAAIDRRVVIDLVREDIEVTEEEADDLLARWKVRFDAGQWQENLAAFGLQEKALKPYIEEIVRYLKTIDLRFGQGVEINAQEVERYYEDVYAPLERAAGREPKPRPQAQAEIEASLKSEKVRQLSANWVRSLRAQAEVRINERCLEQAK